jgi:adenosylcobinamide-GDP ribazoletransferase
MKALLDTIQFLTIIPLKNTGRMPVPPEESMMGQPTGRMPLQTDVRAELFPVVGLLIGVVLMLLDALYLLVLPPLVAAACAVISLVFLTGGLHIDGLADTADGFFSSRPREEILRIMRDSRTGAMGATAVACLLILKVAALSSVTPEARARAILLAPIAGRCAMAMAMGYLPPARPDGLAAMLRPKKVKNLQTWPAVFLLIAGALVWGMSGIVVSAISLIALAPLSLFIWRKIGGMTGDTLGATCEVVEAVALMAAAALG